MDEQVEADLLKYMEEFSDEATQRWYAACGFPYQRGYLVHGPPGTGESSFSLSIADQFDMDISTLNLSGVGDAALMKLCANLPPRFVILEDLDTAGLGRRDDGHADQPTNQISRVTLSGLLNVLDGVSSKGRVLIMSTNHVEHLDKALIRPGRIDKKVYFELASRDITAQLFRTVFTQMPDSNKHSMEEVNGEMIERLAIEFAAKVPEMVFSPAEVLSFLLERKKSPAAAVSDVQDWVVKATGGTKLKREFLGKRWRGIWSSTVYVPSETLL
ncbi:P-loop containing nucleoside triphosphate hydrolase protein [Aspergillus lucknowensis]|uniref:P-loop containing nucleoside triphosphate hydrolase protein n=1 Tax=Aspergillus lucknowensis TaxID=176173 RepID=A0ABR4L667_9EURO